MTIVLAFVLGLVQGLTEFIPVSSSGHLVVLHDLFNAETGGLGFDVALHIGTLMALCLYFWKDILDLTRRLFEGKKRARLPLMIALACVPAVIAGVVLQDFAESIFRNPLLVAINLAVFGAVMLIAEKYAAAKKNTLKIEQMTYKRALAVGAFQALALVPGVSRSGSTITGGLFSGMDRMNATRFSFLVAIPITSGAIVKLVADGSLASAVEQPIYAVIGILAAFLSGLVAIKFLLKFVAKHSLATFAYYRFVLAALVIAIVLLKP